MGLLSAVCKFLGIKLSKTAEARITLTISLILGLSDAVSDAYAFSVYWRLQHGLTLAILASVSLAFGVIVLGIQLCIVIPPLWKGELDKEDEDKICFAKYFEIVAESIPQLWISLYVLSSCEQHDVVLYISAAISFLSIVHVTVIASIMLMDDEPATILDYLFLYPLTGLILAPRVLLLVYMSYNLKWWTALLMGCHLLIMGIVSFALLMKDEKFSLKNLLSNIFFGILCGIVFNFTFFFDGDDFCSAFALLFLFVVGNFVAFGVSYNASYEYCLHPDVIAVHVSLNVASIIVLVIYAVVRHFWPRL